MGLRMQLHSGSRSFGSSRRRSRGSGNRELSGGCGVVFGLLFLLPGLAVIYFLSIRPLIKLQEAKSWIRVPAVVLSSEVKSHRGSDSTTYSINISYEYEAGVWTF